MSQIVQDTGGIAFSSWFPTVILTALISHVVYQRFFSSLSNVPGPFLASVSRLWLAQKFRRCDFHRTAIKVHAEYGEIVRIAPNEVSLSDPNAIRTIYGQAKFYKGEWYSALNNKEDFNLLGQMDPHRNRQGRQLIGPILSLKSIRESETHMHDSLKTFVKVFREREGQSVNIVEWTNVLATELNNGQDMLTETTFGQRWGLIERGEASEVLAYVNHNWQSYFVVGLFPRLAKTLKKTSNFRVGFLGTSASKWARPAKLGSLPSVIPWGIKLMEERVKNGKSDPGAPPDMMDKLLRLHNTNPDFDKEALYAMLLTPVFAGFETCGATIPTIIKRIVDVPERQARIHAELDAATKAGKLSDPPMYDQLVHLPYLTACISEGLRMFPVTGTGLPRTVPEGGVVIKGHFLPAGTQVGVHPWALSYNERVAKNAGEFLPERFIEASKEEKLELEKCNLAFGTGVLVCPGKQWATMLINKVLATLFMHFDLELVNPRVEPQEMCIFPVKWKDVQMKVMPRKLK